MRELPIYDVVFKDDDLGMTAVSFVDEPAIEELFVAFKNNKQRIMQIVEDKQEVVSPILIPDQLIYRKYDDKEFYIKWSREVIEQVAVVYLLNQFNNNTTIMHPTFNNNELQLVDVLVDDVYLKRMWIIDDAETDKANNEYGFDLPEGTLMVHYKIYNDELWKRIKNGELKGLSIEAFMTVVATNDKVNNNNNNINMNKKKISVLNKLVAFLNDITEDAEELIDVVEEVDNTDSASIDLTFTLKDGVIVYVDVDKYVRDEEGVLLKAGSYLLDDDNILEVNEEGKVVQTTKTNTDKEEAEVEIPIAEEAEEEVEEEQLVEVVIGENTYKVVNEVKDFIDSLININSKLEEELNDLKDKTPSGDFVNQSKLNNNKKKEDMSTEELIAQYFSK